MKQPNIFEYLDYRAFLRDMFRFRKQQVKHFSYRYFAQKSGFKSPNFLKLVSDGVRNLTAESLSKVARGFELKKQERDFFEFLVFMNQASDHDTKNRYYQKMMSLKGYRDIKRIASAEYEYFSKWYYPVIRELLMFGDRKHKAEDLASLLNPPVTVSEAGKAVQLLMDIGLVSQDETGRWVSRDRNLSTGPEVQSLVVANYHREMLKMASESIERFSAKERDISALVLSVARERMTDLKKRAAAFRKELLELASEETSPDQVVQVNIQIFPLTRLEKGENRC